MNTKITTLKKGIKIGINKCTTLTFTCTLAATLIWITLSKCFHSIFHLCQTSPNKMEHGYQPKAEQDWSNTGEAPHEALSPTQGWTATHQRGNKHHLKQCSNPTMKRGWSKREQAPHEAVPITQGWTGSGQRGNHRHTKHGQKSKENTIMDDLQQIVTSLT